MTYDEKLRELNMYSLAKWQLKGNDIMGYRNLKVASYKQNKGLLDNRMKSREENRTLNVCLDSFLDYENY